MYKQQNSKAVTLSVVNFSGQFSSIWIDQFYEMHKWVLKLKDHQIAFHGLTQD